MATGAEWQHDVPAYDNTILFTLFTLYDDAYDINNTHWVALTHHEDRFDDYVVIL